MTLEERVKKLEEDNKQPSNIEGWSINALGKMALRQTAEILSQKHPNRTH